MLNYALRVNLTIAIVAMVDEPKDSAPKLPFNSSVTLNNTLVAAAHTKPELSSAAHTLAMATTPEPFQTNSTDNVSIYAMLFLFYTESKEKKQYLAGRGDDEEGKNPKSTHFEKWITWS